MLDAARQPLRSTTWHAALIVALSRAGGGDLGRVIRLGRRRFDAAVRRQVARWDAVNPWQKIIDGVFAACADPAGVAVLRHGALERVALLLADWRGTQARLTDTEQRMITVLDELGLTELACSITGLSAVGAAAVLAETGDPGVSPPAARWPGTPASRPGRKPRAPIPAAPAPPDRAARPCAWRAVWGALRSNPACAARFARLTSREHNKLTTGQAHAAIAAALLAGSGIPALAARWLTADQAGCRHPGDCPAWAVAGDLPGGRCPPSALADPVADQRDVRARGDAELRAALMQLGVGVVFVEAEGHPRMLGQEIHSPRP